MSDASGNDQESLSAEDIEIIHTAAEELEERVVESKAVHILYVSAGMIGVCLTVIGVVNLLIRSAGIDVLIDEVLAIDSLVFLGACMFSYLAMGARTTKRAAGRERVADVLMILGLSIMVLISLLTAFELA